MKFHKIKGFYRHHPNWMALIIGILFVFSNLVISNNTRKDGLRFIFWADGLAYYCYLPSAFIFHDLDKFTYGRPSPVTGKPVNKVTAGVAMLQTPFFLIGYGLASMSTPQPECLSETYEFCITMGTLTYVYLALLMLFSVLKQYVKPKSALLSLLIVYLGTNLYYYSVGESGMSHAYSFFTISWFIWALHHFLKKPNWINSMQMGLAIGLSVLIRPTNIFIAGLPFLLFVNDFKGLSARFMWLIKQPYTYLGILFTFLAVLPQLVYWKVQSGSFFYYSYPGETFAFLTSPHIGEVLFGNVAGLFTYSPLLLFFIPGLFFMFKRDHRFSAVGILLIFSAITYLNSSWWIPTFDCSYGHRAFIEYFPMLTLPIAFSMDALFHRWKAIFISALITLLVFVNVRMSYLYKKYPCWMSDYGINWTWKNVAYVYRVVFFIDSRPSNHFRMIESGKSAK